MAKTTMGITIEEEIKKKYSDMVGYGNVSQRIESYMQEACDLQDSDLDGVDRSLVKLRRDNNVKMKEKLTMEIQHDDKLLAKYDQIMTDKKESQLKSEKERIESESKCLSCNDILSEKKKTYRLPKGNVCHACFMSSNAEMVKGWN